MERVADSFVTSSDQSEISEFTRLSHARLACSYVSISSFCRSAAFGLALIPYLDTGHDAAIDQDRLRTMGQALSRPLRHQPLLVLVIAECARINGPWWEVDLPGS